MFFPKHKGSILTIAIALAILAIYFAFQIFFQHDLDRFLPKDKQDHQFLKDYQAKLEPDDCYYLIAVHDKNGIFNSSFLNEFDHLTKRAAKIPGILRATSLTTLVNPIKTPFAMTTIPVIHLDNPAKYKRDSINILNDERLAGRFVSFSGKTALIAMKTKPDLSHGEAADLDETIKAMEKDYHFDKWYVTGKANIQTGFVKLIQKELSFHIVACNIFLLIVLIFLFRRFWTIQIALVSVVLGALYFVGLLGALKIPLDLMSMLFPPLMLIVGMSDVIHFLSKYMDELENGEDQETAMSMTIKDIGKATFLTSLTTSVGFSALYFSKIEPIRSFGITAAIGVFIAYLTVLFFTTAALLYIKPEKLFKKKKDTQFWHKFMSSHYFFVQNNVKLILVATLLTLMISFYGISLISTNTFVLSDVPDNSELMDHVRFFDEELSGIRSFELAILPKGDAKILDFEVLKEIDKVEAYLKDNTAINGILSPLTSIKSLNRAYHSNKATAFVLPEKEKDFKKYKKQLNKIPKNQITVLQSADQKLGRLTGRMVDIGSDEIKKLNDKIFDWIHQNTKTDLVEFKLTGTALLIDKNNDYLRSSLMQSLIFALLAVSLLMALLFRNWKMVLISLIPNIVPLLMAAAVIGFVGIELKGSTSIIFAIAFGIAVDDTIHFLSKFKIEMEKGFGVRQSIFNTYIETGKAIYLTSIILFFGFALLIFSDFKGVYYVGFLISITLFFALAACLLVLPIFLVWALGGEKEERLTQG